MSNGKASKSPASCGMRRTDRVAFATAVLWTPAKVAGERIRRLAGSSRTLSIRGCAVRR
jgi:hypothetical protein